MIYDLFKVLIFYINTSYNSVKNENHWDAIDNIITFTFDNKLINSYI